MANTSQTKTAGVRAVFRPLIAALATLLFLAAVPAIAQQVDEDTVPPPSKLIPKDELARLTAETDVKRRTKLALELMSDKLALAEQSSAGSDFDGTFTQLGVFHGLIDNTLDFLQDVEKDGKKVANNFKRLEIGLRRFPPRLGVIRSALPVRYEFYVRELLRYIRDARAKAIEPLFGDSVIPETKPEDPANN